MAKDLRKKLEKERHDQEVEKGKDEITEGVKGLFEKAVSKLGHVKTLAEAAGEGVAHVFSKKPGEKDKESLAMSMLQAGVKSELKSSRPGQVAVAAGDLLNAKGGQVQMKAVDLGDAIVGNSEASLAKDLRRITSGVSRLAKVGTEELKDSAKELQEDIRDDRKKQQQKKIDADWKAQYGEIQQNANAMRDKYGINPSLQPSVTPHAAQKSSKPKGRFPFS